MNSISRWVRPKGLDVLDEAGYGRGGSDNNVNLKSDGKIRVAVNSTPGFDATTIVDEMSVSFGRTGDEQGLVDCDKPHKDVNGDLLCHFDTGATGFRGRRYRRRAQSKNHRRHTKQEGGRPLVGRPPSCLVHSGGS